MNVTDAKAATAALARAGKQAQAIEAATAALAAPALGKAERIALLDQRAEALIAEGRFGDAASDAEAMLALAGDTPALKLPALMRQALVQMRLSRNKQALTLAEQALALAEAGRDPAKVAGSVLCLAEAQLRAAAHDAALASAMRAAALFEALGDTAGQGRAQWLTAFAYTRLSRNDASRNAAQQAVALARQAGDAYGLANALNVLSFSCRDIAERLDVLQQAETAFERAGYVYGRMAVLGNLSLTLAELGLWRHACRLGEQCMAVSERSGAPLNLALELGAVLKWQLDLGDTAGVRARWSRYDALVDSLDEPVTRADRELWAAELSAAEGDAAGALKRLRAFLRQVRTHNPGFELYVLIPLARLLLQRGDAAAALRATRRGIACLRERGFARTGFGQSQDIWWWHSRALAALGRDDEAWAALQQAYSLMLASVRNVPDEGLRRSYLNKLQVHRTLVPAWLAEAARRGLPDAQRLAHLRLPSSLSDPFKRLVDSGLRLNQLRSEAALHDFLIDEVTELSGAERVLLVLEGVGGRRVVGALLPSDEDAAALLQAVNLWLDEAAATREPRLRHGPEGATEEAQRSCLVTPLVAQGELLGHVYADIEGAFGRFRDADRDLLAMLAALAAVALANLRFAVGLEAQVAERTAEARSAQADAEQRAAELAIINGIQQAMADSLDFQGIVDLVGDKLREVLHTDTLGIRWYDDEARRVSFLYEVERGQRIHPAPRQIVPGGPVEQLSRARQPLLYPTREAMRAAGLLRVGAEQCLSAMRVPIVRGERMVAFISLENYEREQAYGEAELRLVSTIAASMGVALDNARLFKETQEALEQQTATADVLGVISRSMGDAAPVLDAILEKCEVLIDESVGSSITLVGDDGLVHMGHFRLNAAGKAFFDTPAAADAVVLHLRSRPPAPYAGSPVECVVQAGRAVIYPDVVHGPDVPDSLRKVAHLLLRGRQTYALLAVPLFQNGRGLGTISVARYRTGGFSDKEIALLQTFADQAVVAIENARLFNQTQEALAHQTASADILRVISSSPTDVQPVFEAIVGTAVKHLGCDLALVQTVSGDTYSPQAMATPAGLAPVPGAQRMPVDPNANFPSRAIRSKAMLHVSDWSAVELPPHEQVRHQQLGLNSALYLPLLRGDDCVGVLVLGSKKANAFNPKAIALAESFRDQALIAIENTRLFNETQEALERQTATAEVLQAIAGSVSDAQPVLEKILDSCTHLFDVASATVMLVGEDGLLHLSADRLMSRKGAPAGWTEADFAAAAERTRAVFPMPLAGTGTAAAITSGQVLNFPDVLNGADVPRGVRAPALALGINYSQMMAPLMQGTRGLGAIAMSRATLGGFTDREQALLKTFADQAVIVDPERAAVPRDAGGAGTPDRDERGAQCHRRVGGRRATGIRQDHRQRRAVVPGGPGADDSANGRAGHVARGRHPLRA